MEKMTDFFAARIDEYEDQMLNRVEGCAAAYKKVAGLLPSNTKTLLDLGCGTGLELDEIYKVYPDLEVTGIDLTLSMLDKLKQKHPGKNLQLVNASCFDHDFGIRKYNIALSFQTMHHFEHEP